MRFCITAGGARSEEQQEQEQLGSWLEVQQQRLGVAMEMPGRVAMETADESTESVVLQCTSSGDVEDGEEVVRSEPASERVMFVPTSTLGGPKRFAFVKTMASRGREWEEDVVVRSSGVRAWLTDDAAYWNSGGRVRTRRNKEMKGHVEDSDVVEKTHAKRKLEESKECDRLSESEVDEGTDSDAESSSSSSDSDASESEEESSWRANKRRRAGEEARESVYLKSRRGRSSLRREEKINFDSELKEMQLLLELQLKASERREAGMKQRMETMMALMSKHMGHVEKRVSTLEDQPQEQVLERINVKLEKVMEGFTTLNENLSILSACLSKDL